MSAFVSRMAWRETRAAWRHFAYFFVCIALGVAALVGVDLFAANLERAIQREARSLMGADVELRTTRPLTSEAEGVLMKLDGRGIARMQVSELVAMAAVPSGTQLVELKAVEPGYPFYGKLRVDPEDALTPKAVQAELAATFPDKTVRVSTYLDAQPMLRRFLRQLTMYLGLVGLIALMVGGIGVASSVRAFLKEKLETIAVLKAIGAG